MGTGYDAPKTMAPPVRPEPAMLSLQQRLEQIEASLDRAHAITDDISPRGGVATNVIPEASGAGALAERCIVVAEHLCERLSTISALTGRL